MAISRILLALLTFGPFLHAQTFPSFRWIVEARNSGSDQLAGLGTDAQGNIYLAGTTQSPNARGADVFVTKLDPMGNVVYSTLVGGSASEFANAMAVDPAGDVYVAGTTTSTDFPTTAGAFSPSVPLQSGSDAVVTFLFKLNPDASVGYSTYFANSAGTVNAIAVDSSGAVFLTGPSYGGVPITAGAWRTTCACVLAPPMFGFASASDAFLSRFDPTGSRLVFSTYLGAEVVPNALVVAPDGSAFIAGPTIYGGTDGVFHMNSTGTTLLASAPTGIGTKAVALARDGSLYLSGQLFTGAFHPTSSAFQSTPGLAPNVNNVPAAIIHIDAELKTVAGTYFGGAFGTAINAMTLDPTGNVYVGGYTSPRSLPTRTPFVQGFGSGTTGYVAKLSGDLSTLLFSSEFGDNQAFSVNGLAIGSRGDLLLGGSTGTPSQNVWVNSVTVTDPPALRIDAIENFSSQLSDPIVAGETILVRGAGFTNNAQLLVGGATATPISIGPTNIVAVLPPVLTGDNTTVQVLSGGLGSNSVTVAVDHLCFRCVGTPRTPK